MCNNTTIASTVTIGDTELPIVEYKGKRAITLTMMDKAHKRPDKTAARNFRQHRDKLIKGEDYDVLDFAQNSEIRGIDIPPRGLTILYEFGYLMLVKSFTDDLAWQVQRELVNKYFVLSSHPTQPLQQSSDRSAPNQKLVDEVFLANAAANMLRMSDDSRLKMLYKIGVGYQLSQDLLPDYTEDRPTKALSTLLKEHGASFSPQCANRILVELGILEIQSRPSTKYPDKIKKFKSLTERGLEYGKNLISPHNQRETQPHYYCDTFPKLLDLIHGSLP